MTSDCNSKNLVPLTILNKYGVPMYSITFGDKYNVKEAFEMLTKLGFVLTEARCANVDDVHRGWQGREDMWKYFSTGESTDECKMILHAGAIIYTGNKRTKITLDDFIKNVYPTW